MFLPGNHIITFKNVTENDLADIKVNGVRFFAFCQGMFASMRSFLKTLLLYLGGLGSNPKLPIIGTHVPFYMDWQNAEFLEKNM